MPGTFNVTTMHTQHHEDTHISVIYTEIAFTVQII